NQQRDYHKKLADHLMNYGDVFFVGKSIVRSQEGKLADGENHESEQNWNVQNTGSLSEMIRLLAWRATRAGKLVIEVLDSSVRERDYRVRKIMQAREHLVYGLSAEEFPKTLSIHYEGGDASDDSFNQDHIKALLAIAGKSDPTKYRRVKIAV